MLWLGAYSPGALILPDATPTPSQMYAPRGVFMDDDYLVVADTGNHRLLIWHGHPTEDKQPADVVLGSSALNRGHIAHCSISCKAC